MTAHAGHILSGVFRFRVGILGFSTAATFVRGRNVSRRISASWSRVCWSTARTAPQFPRRADR